MRDFDPDVYLTAMPTWIGDVDDERLEDLCAEAGHRLRGWEQAWADYRASYERWQAAVERYRRGERKTYPYPAMPYRETRRKRGYLGMQNYCGEWAAYWRGKLEVIEAERARRGRAPVELPPLLPGRVAPLRERSKSGAAA